jgi:hypothetical protein
MEQDDNNQQQDDPSKYQQQAREFMDSITKKINRTRHESVDQQDDETLMGMLVSRINTTKRSIEIQQTVMFLLNKDEGFMQRNWEALPVSFVNAFVLIRSLLGLQDKNLNAEQIYGTLMAMHTLMYVEIDALKRKASGI